MSDTKAAADLEADSQDAQALPAAPYELTPRERTDIEAFRDRKQSRPTAVAMAVNERAAGETILFADHPSVATGNALLANSIGSGSIPFAQTLIEGLATATARGGRPQEAALNSALATVQALQPRDEAEAMLAAQIAIVHHAIMHSAYRLQNAETPQQLEVHDRCLNRLTRTYVAQMDALKRYRSGGQQHMTVEHVHVHEGGQAIVGSVHHGGGGARPKSEATS